MRGLTLIELVVALSVLGAAGAVAAVSLRPPPTGVREDATIADARRQALAEGRSVTITLSVGPDSLARAVTVEPNGRVVADSGFHLNPFSGRVADGAR